MRLPCRPENSAAASEVEGPDRAAILSARRVRRLEILVQLRKLYRNLIRGDSLLAEPAPVYRAEGLNSLPLRVDHSAVEIRYPCWGGGLVGGYAHTLKDALPQEPA